MSDTSHFALTDRIHPFIPRPDETSYEKTFGPEGVGMHFGPSVHQCQQGNDTALDADHSSDEEEIIIDQGNIFSEVSSNATVSVNFEAANQSDDEIAMDGGNVFHWNTAKNSITIVSSDDGGETEVEDDALFETPTSGVFKKKQPEDLSEDKPCFSLRDYPEAVGYSFRQKTSMSGRYSPSAYLQSTHASNSSNSSWQSTEPDVHVDSSREWDEDAESADDERERDVKPMKPKSKAGDKWSEDDLSLLFQLRDGRGLSFKRIHETKLFENRTLDAIKRAHVAYRSPKPTNVDRSWSSRSGLSAELEDHDDDAESSSGKIASQSSCSEFPRSKDQFTGRDSVSLRSETPASGDVEASLAGSDDEDTGNGYNEEDIRRIITLREKHHMTFSEIRESGLFGNRSTKSINHIYRKYRPIKDVERKPIHGVTKGTRHYRRWTEQEFAAVLRLRRMGMNWGEMKRSGRFSNRTEAAIANGWQMAKERQARQKEEAEERRRREVAREVVRDAARISAGPTTTIGGSPKGTISSTSPSKYRWI